MKSCCSVCYVPQLCPLLDHISKVCTCEVYRLKKSPQSLALSCDTVLQKGGQVQSSRAVLIGCCFDWFSFDDRASVALVHLIAPGYFSYVALCHVTTLWIVGISSGDRPHNCRLLGCGLTGGGAVGHGITFTVHKWFHLGNLITFTWKVIRFSRWHHLCTVKVSTEHQNLSMW